MTFPICCNWRISRGSVASRPQGCLFCFRYIPSRSNDLHILVLRAFARKNAETRMFVEQWREFDRKKGWWIFSDDRYHETRRSKLCFSHASWRLTKSHDARSWCSMKSSSCNGSITRDNLSAKLSESHFSWFDFIRSCSPSYGIKTRHRSVLLRKTI